jgi:solute:Na+ symporter, SSS family
MGQSGGVMRTGILAAVLAYEILSILGITWWLRSRRVDAKRSFILGGRDVGWQVLSVTLALTVLGSAHILGMFEQSWHLGAVSLWFSFAHVALLVFICVGSGRWVRRLGVSSMPELTSLLYGPTVRLMTCCVMIPLLFGILTLEMQGMGIVFSLLCGFSIQSGILIGCLLGCAYVILGGLEEVVFLNVINALVKYVGIVVAMVYLTYQLPQGWSGVEKFYLDANQASMLSIWGTPDTLVSFGISVVFAVVLCQSVNQMAMHPVMAAKDELSVMKAMWPACLINGLFAVFTVSMGLAAKSIPEFYALGPKMAAPSMLMAYLPAWLVALILAVFLGSILSAFSMICLGAATIFTKDIYINLFNSDAAGGAMETRVVRLTIVFLIVLGATISRAIPPIAAAVQWLFAWCAPIFVCLVVGLFWKRSTGATILSFIGAWTVNTLWSFTDLPSMLGLQVIAHSNIYPTVIVALILQVGLTLVLKGSPGYFTIKTTTPCAVPGE